MHATTQSAKDNIDSLLDINAVRSALEKDTDQIIPALKQAVSCINDGLKQFYKDGVDVEDIVYGRASLIDQLLVCVFDHFFGDIKQPIALAAVGGYGRGELHPASAMSGTR